MSSKTNNSAIDFQSPTIKSIRIQNHEDIFDALRSDAEVREKLRRILQPGGDPAFLIVALLIWMDPSFTDSRDKTTSMDWMLEVPVSKEVQALTGVPLPDVNAELRYDTDSRTQRVLQGRIEGGTICGFQYRTVRRKFGLFGPQLKKYGPRIESGQSFHKDTDDAGKEEGKDEVDDVEMDEDYVSWTETLNLDDELQVEMIGDISVAFDM